MWEFRNLLFVWLMICMQYITWFYTAQQSHPSHADWWWIVSRSFRFTAPIAFSIGTRAAYWKLSALRNGKGLTCETKTDALHDQKLVSFARLYRYWDWEARHTWFTFRVLLGPGSPSTAAPQTTLPTARFRAAAFTQFTLRSCRYYNTFNTSYVSRESA